MKKTFLFGLCILFLLGLSIGVLAGTDEIFVTGVLRNGSNNSLIEDTLNILINITNTSDGSLVYSQTQNNIHIDDGVYHVVFDSIVNPWWFLYPVNFTLEIGSVVFTSKEVVPVPVAHASFVSNDSNYLGGIIASSYYETSDGVLGDTNCSVEGSCSLIQYRTGAYTTTNFSADRAGSGYYTLLNLSAGNSSNISISDGIFTFNMSCTQITGSEDLCDSTDADSNASTACSDGEYLDGNGLCISFNNTVSTIFEETQVIYNATSINTEVGTVDGGDLTNIIGLPDGSTYNVSEVTGTPGFMIYVNFTNVIAFNVVALAGQYFGGAGHTVALELLRVGVGWEEREEITDQMNQGVTTFDVFIGSDFIDGSGTVQFRLNHDDSGITSHDYQLDTVLIGQVSGIVVGGDLGDLTGRDESCILLPDVFCKDGSKNLTGQLNGTSALFINDIIANAFNGTLNGFWNESSKYQLTDGAYKPANFSADRAGSGYYTLLNLSAGNSSNISISDGIFTFNMSCTQITGSEDLCDGSDATGMVNLTDINMTNAYFDLVEIYSTFTCTDCVDGTNIDFSDVTLTDLTNDVGYPLATSLPNISMLEVADRFVNVSWGNVTYDAEAYKPANFSADRAGSGYYTDTNFTVDYYGISSRYNITNFSIDYASTGYYTTINFSSEFTNSSNISISNGIFTFNMSCTQITGDAGLCDSDDATGVINLTDINMTNSYFDLVEIYSTFTCTDCVGDANIDYTAVTLADFPNDINAITNTSDGELGLLNITTNLTIHAANIWWNGSGICIGSC